MYYHGHHNGCKVQRSYPLLAFFVKTYTNAPLHFGKDVK